MKVLLVSCLFWWLHDKPAALMSWADGYSKQTKDREYHRELLSLYQPFLLTIDLRLHIRHGKPESIPLNERLPAFCSRLFVLVLWRLLMIWMNSLLSYLLSWLLYKNTTNIFNCGTFVREYFESFFRFPTEYHFPKKDSPSPQTKSSTRGRE